MVQFCTLMKQRDLSVINAASQINPFSPMGLKEHSIVNGLLCLWENIIAA